MSAAAATVRAPFDARASADFAMRVADARDGVGIAARATVHAASSIRRR